MTTETLDNIAELLAKATPGPWLAAVQKPGALFTWLICRSGAIAGTAGRFKFADAELIATLVNAASELLALAREALESRKVIEGAPHAEDCAYLNKFIHEEPCPFWTKKYCLTEDCVHGVAMGDVCPDCPSGNTTPIWGPDAKRCHEAPCNCWKSKLLEARKV